MADAVNLVVMVGLCLYAGGVFWWMSRIGQDGDPESGKMLMGLKTSATTKSLKHWGVAHRAASTSCKVTAGALFVRAAVALVVGLTHTAATGVWAGGIGMLAVEDPPAPIVPTVRPRDCDRWGEEGIWGMVRGPDWRSGRWRVEWGHAGWGRSGAGKHGGGCCGSWCRNAGSRAARGQPGW